MADLIIRQAEEKDVPAIEEIEKQCFTDPWSYESLYRDIVENGLAFYVVAQTDGRVCGYVGSQTSRSTSPTSAHVTNFWTS